MNKKIETKKIFSFLPQKILVTTIAGIMASLVLNSTLQASDIEIYQKGKEGDRTLMLMIDISRSMDRRNGSVTWQLPGYACDLPSGVTDTSDAHGVYDVVSINHNNNQLITTQYEKSYCSGSDGKKYYDRIARVKEALIDVLNGNSSKNIIAQEDKTVIGLSSLGFSSFDSGAILVPARRLDAIVDSANNLTQRDVLINEISKLRGVSGTPTARSYAEVVAYLFGTNTNANPIMSTYYETRGNRLADGGDGWSCNSPWSMNGSDYRRYIGTDGDFKDKSIEIAWCADHSNSSWTRPNGTVPLKYTATRELFFDPTPKSRDATNTVSGFTKSVNSAKDSALTHYTNPTSISSQKDKTVGENVCNGQAIYVLTDGEPNTNWYSDQLMKNALHDKRNELICEDSESGIDCSLKLAAILADPKRNPTNLKIKTAMVGFGNDFNQIDSSVKTVEQVDSLSGISEGVKGAAKLGIIGEGGWYSGNSSEVIVESIKQLIEGLGADIKPVTTGSPTIAKDSLNPSVLQPVAYYPQFQPTPDKSYQTWVGNLKKYDIDGEGVLRDKNNNKILNSNASLVDNYDLWSKSVETAVADGDESVSGSKMFALKGGGWSKLQLKLNDQSTENRKVMTNRVVDSNDATRFKGGTALRQIRISDLTAADSKYKSDPNRAHLISLLGYSIDPSNLATISLDTAPELRQIGAVMHSSPLLLTNKGEVAYDDETKSITSKDREDYILFGSTQGLLHVVDADTGTEKFAFVPNEMVENQKQAFLKSDLTRGGLNKLYYGIDGAWTSYTEYVIDNDAGLTVDKGKAEKSGKQMVYGGLRMGGRSYYALDLQNINDPKLRFQISPADNKVYFDGSSKTFDQLQYMGQSWSKPTIAWVKWGNQRKRVMFVGGGYDAGGVDGDARDASGSKGEYAGYESDSYNPTLAKGAGIYMFDAENGDLLWWSSSAATTSLATAAGVIGLKNDHLKYSVVSEIRAEDRDSDGLTDHLYFGDLGGQVFRIDLNNQAATIGAFAQHSQTLLNLHDGAKSPRFYEMPAFSVYDNNGKSFAVISIGSGNRSLPLQEYMSTATGYDYDAIYNIYDKDVTASGLYNAGYSLKPTFIKSDLSEITQENRIDNTTLVAPYSTNGWYYKFKNGASIQSTKVISPPVVTNYKLYISTFDSSKSGIGGQCGSGIKGESFLNTFCMPYGQCLKNIGESSGNTTTGNIECTTSDGCSIGAGLQTATVVPTKCEGTGCSATGGGGIDSTPKGNANYCFGTGQIGLSHNSGVTGKSNSKMCLVPQRWYQAFM